MALPNSISAATPAGSDSPSLGDDQIRALKTAIEDILGIPDATSITVKAFSIVAGGLDEIVLMDGAAGATAAGRVRRNATTLTYHDGTAARTLAVIDAAQTISAVKTFTAVPIVAIDDATNNAVVNAMTIRHTTSGSPAAGIGTRLTFQSESGDENPSDAVALDAAFSDVTAGSEDSVFRILLRVAGGALDGKYEFGSTAGSGFMAIFTHAVTANRTYTLPDSSGTLSVAGSTDPLTLTTGAASPPVANTLYKDNILKAWARVANSGSPSLADSFNVSGVVDEGTGTTTITINTDMANGNYVAVAQFAEDTTIQSTIFTGTYATTGFRVLTRNHADTLTDYAFGAAVYGDQ